MSASLIKFLNADFDIAKANEKICYVSKKIIKDRYKSLMNNEIYWLKKLSAVNFVTNVVSFSEDEFVMTYAGEPVTEDTLPCDWRVQVDNMLSVLKKESCCHNDIKNEEILVKNGKLNLIDFEHATSTREEFKSRKLAGLCGCRMSWEDKDAFINILSHMEQRKEGAA